MKECGFTQKDAAANLFIPVELVKAYYESEAKVPLQIKSKCYTLLGEVHKEREKMEEAIKDLASSYID